MRVQGIHNLVEVFFARELLFAVCAQHGLHAFIVVEGDLEHGNFGNLMGRFFRGGDGQAAVHVILRHGQQNAALGHAEKGRVRRFGAGAAKEHKQSEKKRKKPFFHVSDTPLSVEDDGPHAPAVPDSCYYKEKSMGLQQAYRWILRDHRRRRILTGI